MSENMIRTLQNRIDLILNYLTPFQHLINCHMVDYITQNHWKCLLPQNVVQEVEEFGTLEAVNELWRIKDNLLQPSENIIDRRFKNLLDFVKEANRHCLKPDGVLCLTVDQMREKLKSLGAENLDSLKINEFMSDKKSHEVEVLSSMVATMSSWSGVTHVVELGGGKGFLAAMLAMLYSTPVLNIDCSQTNARGALLRNAKIQRQWPGLVKKAEAARSGIKTEKVGRFQRGRTTTVKNQSNNNESSNLDENILKISGDIGNVLNIDNSNKVNENSLYQHLVEYITPKTDLKSLVEEHFHDASSDIKLCLAGLHTCGDLGSTTVKLFQKCPSSSVLCAVPCCYHLLTENIDEHCLSDMNDCPAAGFPTSDYLRGKNIGRNARMLASQSVDRTFSSRQLPSNSLYYRALLQVLIRDNGNGSICPEGKMKKVGEKCSNFPEYVRVAVDKLKLDSQVAALTDDELNNMETCYKVHKETLNVFYLLRMSLAPVIESLILLDRLMFLAECGFSGSVGESFIVKMFDPVVSPRCHSLVAYRKKN